MTSPVVWITGVNGFSGRFAAAHISKFVDQATVVGSDVSTETDAPVDHYERVDIRDQAALSGFVDRFSPTHVMHLAGRLPPSDPADLWEVNVGGTLNLIRSLTAVSSARLLLIGSAAEYALQDQDLPLDEGSPLHATTSYGQSKLAQTTTGMGVAKSVGVACNLVRTFNLLGPGIPDSLLPGTLAAQFANPNSNELVVGDIECERDFIDIRDAVAAYWNVLSHGRPGDIFNVCRGAPTRVCELIKLFEEESGRSLPIRFDERRVSKQTIKTVYGSNEQIRLKLGWTPQISIRESVRGMLGMTNS